MTRQAMIETTRAALRAASALSAVTHRPAAKTAPAGFLGQWRGISRGIGHERDREA